MGSKKIFMTVVVLLFMLSAFIAPWPVGAVPTPDNEIPPNSGMKSTALETLPGGPASQDAPEATVTAIKTVTAKSIRQEDFSPVIETSLFTTNDYAVYAWIHFSTGASFISARLNWHFLMPDGSSFDTISPWWSFGSEGMATMGIYLNGYNPQLGRWQVNYSIQLTEGGPWQELGEDIFFVNAAIPCQQYILNGGFESGSADWQKSANTTIGADYPHWGSQGATLGGGNSSTYWLSQDVQLPTASPGDLTLAYYYNIYTEDSSSLAYDYFRIQIRDLSGNLLRELDSSNNTAYFGHYSEDVWEPITFDISEFSGQKVRIYAEVTTDVGLPTKWDMDDFSVMNCNSSKHFRLNVILAEPKDVIAQGSFCNFW